MGVGVRSVGGGREGGRSGITFTQHRRIELKDEQMALCNWYAHSSVRCQ